MMMKAPEQKSAHRKTSSSRAINQILRESYQKFAKDKLSLRAMKLLAIRKPA
jgi:hypothetical protein